MRFMKIVKLSSIKLFLKIKIIYILCLINRIYGIYLM